MISEFDVAHLRLDQRNPRYPETASQAAAIRLLVDDEYPKLLNLATDIVTTGELNPIDIPCVVIESGSPVVVEGNRRIASLKVLRRPTLAGTKAAAFKELAKDGKGPDSVACHVADSREAAYHWIELRHTGENRGVGVKPWSSEQANRFRRVPGSQADKAARFCDAMLDAFADDQELASDIEEARKRRITTIGRLIADPNVAHALGVRITGDAVLLQFPPEELRIPIKHLFKDLAAPDFSVTHIKNKRHRADYIHRPDAKLPDPAKRLSTPVLPAAASGPAQRASKSASASNTPKPETVIFEKLKLAQFSPQTRQVLRASQKIKIADATPVCAVMLRVIVELAATEVCTVYRIGKEDDRLKKKLRAALLLVDPDCANPTKRNKALEAAWTGSQADTQGGGIAVEQMNSYVHNFMAHPTVTEVRNHSLNFAPLLQALDDYRAANP